MQRKLLRNARPGLVALFAAAAVLAGCGDSTSDTDTSVAAGTTADHRGGSWGGNGSSGGFRCLWGHRHCTRPTVTNSPPTISGTPSTTVEVGTSYDFSPTASDANSDALSFSIKNMPAWATFSAATGRLGGTPGASSAGRYIDIVISVSDGKVSATLPAFTIDVVTTAPDETPPTDDTPPVDDTPPPVDTPPAGNAAPTIGGSPTTSITAGNPYSFTPTALDADGDALMFAITGKPSWATFDPTTGALTGNPSAAATHRNIVISASDGKVSAALPAFTITVVTVAPPQTNTAPTISGRPATSVVAGSAYSFAPNAGDSDGDKLTFTIQNKPDWATFNATTGALAGSPTAAHVGRQANIIISVTDGSATTALAAFAISVTAAQSATGAATLSWTPPTTNTDGSALTSIKGYRIRYGTSSAMTQSREVGAGLTAYTIDSLSAGTWYFAIQAYTETADGALSTPVTKAIK